MARSGDLLPPSPPFEKATACQDQTGKATTGDGERERRRPILLWFLTTLLNPAAALEDEALGKRGEGCRASPLLRRGRTVQTLAKAYEDRAAECSRVAGCCLCLRQSGNSLRGKKIKARAHVPS